MAILTQPQLSALRVRLYDFRKNLDAYVRSIQDQIIKGFSFTESQKGVKAQYDGALLSLNTKLARLTGVIEGRSLDGQLVTDEAVRALLESFKVDLETMQKAVVEWNRINPIGIAINTVAKLGSAVFSSLDAVFDVVGGAVSGTAAALKWLPWVVLGFIVLPPAIRVAIKARKGGVDAALESTADEMDAVKQKAKEAAASAGRAVVAAGKFLV
jgi:hypothetical protein